ncbi:MAG TPA: hypothetical protein VKA83_00745 [Methylomirabilota bacterium]|nr:hypothetical protein [Methylomirabilota bacterium]
MAAYEVVSVTEEEVPDPNNPGNFVDVFNVTFTIPPKGDQFTIQVPESGDPVAAAFAAANAKTGIVTAIYQGQSTES